MRPFIYERATDVGTAIALVEEFPDAAFLGGGTNLIDLMKLGVETPGALIDISRAGLDHIGETADGGLRIGAGMRNSDVAAHPVVRDRYPLLSDALLAGASAQVRNMATVGGNLLQRTRCRYFQDPVSPCNKRRPGTGCPAIAGENRHLALFGASPHCIATHPSDMAVALSALDASVVIRSGRGERQLPLAELHRLPGDRPQADTNLEPGELITEVLLPPASEGTYRYRKARERATFAFALVSVAAGLRTASDGSVAEVRLALGGVAHRPWRATAAEQAMLGRPAEPAVFAAAIDEELAAATPQSGNAYKLAMVRNMVVSSLTGLAAGVGREPIR